jgi:16S rRNA (guanine(966)-N(2))-methyltransferase RsmD
MKDNIRESLFNLVGGWLPGKHVFDLFAGSGAVGLEALSRGAVHATLIERHFPTVRVIRENIARLDAAGRCTVVASDTFFWARQFLSSPANFPREPWAIFCCPPYDLFIRRQDDLLELVGSLLKAAPDESLFVVESDQRFDPARLPDAEMWRVRQYVPAQLCVWRPPGANR